MKNVISIDGIFDEFAKECEEIARDCEKEGLPAYGSTYDCRVAAIWDNYYLPDLKALFPEKYDPEYEGYEG